MLRRRIEDRSWVDYTAKAMSHHTWLELWWEELFPTNNGKSVFSKYSLMVFLLAFVVWGWDISNCQQALFFIKE